MAGRLNGHVPLVGEMPNLGIGIGAVGKNALVLNCTLRLGDTTVGDVGNPHRIPLPALSGDVACASRFPPNGACLRRLAAGGTCASPTAIGRPVYQPWPFPGFTDLPFYCGVETDGLKKRRNGQPFVNPGLLNQKGRSNPGATATRCAL